jgi:hypothetical protein
MSSKTSPPAFQKYLAWSALGKVTVCVKVIVQAEAPDPVPEVLAVLPDHVLLVVPTLAALPRLVVTLVKSVLTADKTLMTVPTVGAVLAVKEVFVWAPALVIVFTKLAH